MVLQREHPSWNFLYAGGVRTHEHLLKEMLRVSSPVYARQMFLFVFVFAKMFAYRAWLLGSRRASGEIREKLPGFSAPAGRLLGWAGLAWEIAPHRVVTMPEGLASGWLFLVSQETQWRMHT